MSFLQGAHKQNNSHNITKTAKPLNLKTTLPRSFRLLSGNYIFLTLTLLLGTIAIIANVFGPKLLGDATNIVVTGVQQSANQNTELDLNGTTENQVQQYIPQIDFTALQQTLLLVLVLYIISSILSWLQNYFLNIIVQRAIFFLRESISQKIPQLPLSYFDKNPRGEILSKITNDVDNLSQTLTQTLSQIFTAIITVTGITIIMFTISPHLAAIVLLGIPASMLITILVAKKSQKLFVTQWEQVAKVNAHIEDSFTGHEIVKIFGRQKELQEQFDTKNASLYRATFGAQLLSGIIMPAVMFISNLLYVIIVVFGGILVVQGSITLGAVQAIIQYARRFGQPINQLASMVNIIQSGAASAERIFEFLDAKEHDPLQSSTKNVSPNIEISTTNTTSNIEFQKVSFGYNSDKLIISNLSFKAATGNLIAIVGETGAGKSTIINLLLRFYQPQGGKILLNGQNINSLNLENFRRSIGVVLQDPWLCEASIADNIRYGKPEATQIEVIEAAHAAHAHNFIASLPQGYDTIINEQNANISLGERQLITIARAFLTKPKLLVLDEATSSIDTRTEIAIGKAMRNLSLGRTSFVIAHRLSTIREANLILVIESGKIVEQGTHEELLSRKGEYATLYNTQFREEQ